MMDYSINWISANEGLLAAFGLLSLFLFLTSLITFPLIIIYLPHNYFIRTRPSIATLNPIRMMLRITKNAFGVFLIMAGLLMLFLPGQGLLSLFLGVSLIDFPGKRRLELRLLRLKSVHNSVTWIRQKANRQPIILQGEDS